MKINLHEKERIALLTDTTHDFQLRQREEEWYSTKGGLRVTNVIHSELYWFPVDGSENQPKIKRPTVIIAPGGGYQSLGIEYGGSFAAQEFNKLGINACVLKYRLPMIKEIPESNQWPLKDMQYTIKMLRQKSEIWGIEPNKIGVVGFSAGGHLAGMASTCFHQPVIETEGVSVRPDFSVLVYPVISLQEGAGHGNFGSRANLVGKNPSQDIFDHYCVQNWVSAETPPAYLCHAEDDKVVDISNSYLYKEKLDALSIPCELDILPKGGHAFGMKEYSPAHGWFERAGLWVCKNYL